MAQEYIYGILESCYNGVPIIRGYASYKTLIRLSSAHPAYQRAAEETHVEDIENFLRSPSGLKYMPEVVLSYDCIGLWDHPEDWSDPGLPTPIDYLDSGAEYIGGTLMLRDHCTGLNLQRIKGSIVGIKLIRLDVSPTTLISQASIFRRIDGNHRLEALEKANLDDYKIPFCIVLLTSSGKAELHDREQVEMEIFHNINSKAKPLTSIEQYRGLFSLFTVDELNKYGQEFSITKAYLEKHGALRFTNIAEFLADKEDIILYCIKYFTDRGIAVTEDDIADILSKLEHTYFADCGAIRHCLNRFALVPYVFYCLEGEKQKNAKLNAYNAWFIKNKLFSVKDFDPASMIDVFNSIYALQTKQIFVAMPFKEELNFVFDAICDTVTKINRENDTELLMPIRIDKQIVGFSYDIVSEMLDKIQNAGLLIADLTEQNANVYYEAGFTQGLLRAKLGNTAQILYLVSNPSDPEHPHGEVKFDVNHFKVIGYKNVGNGVSELKASLERELKAFYCI